MITGKTGIYGIFGFPVTHTFSPRMHNAAFRRIGLDACYIPFAVPPQKLKAAAGAILSLGIRGLNITVPHKETIIPFLDDLSVEAALIGAVNTIEVKEGRLIGHNTDGRGFLRSLHTDAGVKPERLKILILGSGGAARAVGFSLALGKAAAIALYDVDARKAARLARDIRSRTGVHTVSIKAAGIADAAVDADCIVNATPLGLKKQDPLPLSPDVISKRHLVCDLVYNPVKTPLLVAAKMRGAGTLPGIGMLLYQGVSAFELWTGERAPIAVMKRELTLQMR